MSMQAETLTSEGTAIPGELLYEYTPKFTQVVEYGASAEARDFRCIVAA